MRDMYENGASEPNTVAQHEQSASCTALSARRPRAVEKKLPQRHGVVCNSCLDMLGRLFPENEGARKHKCTDVERRTGRLRGYHGVAD